MDIYEINEIMLKNIPDEALRSLEILNKNGFEAFVVGGCVRDSILGKIPNDWDITTNATPEQVREIFEKENKCSVWDSGIKHGTVTIVLDGFSIECTTYRIETEYEDNRHPKEVIFASNLEDDLARRDFTINALAWSPVDGFVDNYNGLNDLEQGIIRAVGIADERMTEDALRMMRAIRFSAKLGFEIDKELEESLIKNSYLLENISKERIRDELCKTLMSDNPMYVKKFHETGLMKYICPELDALFDCAQNNKHIFDVGNHTIKTLENSSKDLEFRVALLLHDVGKPLVKKQNEKTGFDQFIHHDKYSYFLSKTILKDLKFTSENIKNISNIIKFHDFALNIEPNTYKIHRKLADLIVNNPELDKKFFDYFIEMKKCDLNGKNLNEPKIQKDIKVINMLEKELNSILDGPHKIKDLAVNGNDLLGLEKVDKKGIKHICKGKTIGELLKILQEEVINGTENSKENLMELSKKKLIQAENNIVVNQNKKDKELDFLGDIIESCKDYRNIIKNNIEFEKVESQEKKIQSNNSLSL